MDLKILLTGALPFILIMTAFFTALISLFLLYQYRRSTIALMGKYAPQFSGSVPEQADSEEENPFPLEFIQLNESLKEDIDDKAQGFYSRLTRSSWHSVLIYTSAGLGYAMILSIAFLLSSKIEFLPFRFLTSLWTYLFPALFSIYLVAIPDKRIRRVIPLGYFLIYLAIIFLAAASDWTVMASIVFFFFQINLPPSLLVISFLNKYTRAVAPLIMAFIFFAITGIVLALVYGLEPMSEVLRYSDNWVIGIFRAGTRVFGPTALVPVSLLLLMLSGLFVMGLFGIALQAWIKKQYEHKKVSDQSLLIDAIWLVFALYQPIQMTFENPWWIFSGLFAFLVFKTITKVGFSIKKRKATLHSPPQLLFLRVFSLGEKSQKLYKAITAFWRHGGNVLFITGPDLITSTVEPHDFLDFLSKKLSQRFIDSEETLNKQAENIDLIPDVDGVYRIHDFFCYDNTWKMALSRLTKESEVILMDLRSFSKQNAGCIFEIKELINAVRLEQVIFLIDKTTNEEYMTQIMMQAWEKISPTSPNGSSPGKLRLFEYTSGETQNLLRALAIATSQS